MRGVMVNVGGLSVARKAGHKANEQNSQNGTEPRHMTTFCNRIKGQADTANRSLVDPGCVKTHLII